MPSPFPGMNPYLERADVWQDFHTRFLADNAEAGTYEAEIHASPPEPPLSPDDAAWAAQFVPAKS